MANGAVSAVPGSRSRFLVAANTRHHTTALYVFMFVVLAHWAEHIVQGVQVYALGWSRPDSRGVLGQFFPWLVTSEALHYGYAVVMLIGLWMLRHGFVGRSRRWWNIALGVQVWHHFEHLLLLLQVTVGANLGGRAVPTSIAQLFVERIELHLFYNTIVTVPMVVAMVLHRRPNGAEQAQMVCGCARNTREALAA